MYPYANRLFVALSCNYWFFVIVKSFANTIRLLNITSNKHANYIKFDIPILLILARRKDAFHGNHNNFVFINIRCRLIF